jgi:hypothetical protein
MFEFKDRYFTYQLWNVLHLKSYNHLRMYEILKQYEKTGIRTLSLDKLKELIGLEATEYPMWQDFKRWVLNSCQKALADKTDIKFTYHPTRNGRGGKVTGVEFTIEKNTSFDGQITFDEFLGYTSEHSDTFQLTFDELESKQFEITAPTNEYRGDKLKSTGKCKKPSPRELTPEEREKLHEYTEVCRNQFTDNQTQDLYELLTNRITEQRRIENGYRKAYLQEAYIVLLEREQQEVVKNRFAYLKAILQNMLEQKTLEKSNYQ